MKFEIKHRFNLKVLFSIETDSWKLAVEAAIKEKVDIRYADLRSADLSYANLRSADLSYADLSYANLRYADLRSADLRSADLRYTDLRSADLSYADLRSADLSYADLRYADLLVFQFQQHWAYYTFDGSLRIGCIVLPITEWNETFKEIGVKERYSKEQILVYGQFIDMCYKKFLRDTAR